ncbi:unnamed protein product [Ceutorhynchus assimilis]|uniref:Cytochrome c oxidase subunit n=1 Tax=Ceutorhynchus assimilis TaxID=467358 RepID=A0A9N9QKM4_9CUCU|nr:unnamed protein product [Ceutorhynchus assimilis]
MSRIRSITIFRSFWTTGSKGSRKCPDSSSGVELPDHGGKYIIYQRLALFLGLPIVIGLGIFTFLGKGKEEHEREPFHAYPHMRRRTKSFPWGDGKKTLFHNPKMNPLPEGYEDE